MLLIAFDKITKNKVMQIHLPIAFSVEISTNATCVVSKFAVSVPRRGEGLALLKIFERHEEIERSVRDVY